MMGSSILTTPLVGMGCGRGHHRKNGDQFAAGKRPLAAATAQEQVQAQQQDQEQEKGHRGGGCQGEGGPFDDVPGVGSTHGDECA